MTQRTVFPGGGYEALSKQLATILRHKATKLGLTVHAEGYIPIREVLPHIRVSQTKLDLAIAGSKHKDGSTRFETGGIYKGRRTIAALLTPEELFICERNRTVSWTQKPFYIGISLVGKCTGVYVNACSVICVYVCARLCAPVCVWVCMPLCVLVCVRMFVLVFGSSVGLQ